MINIKNTKITKTNPQTTFKIKPTKHRSQPPITHAMSLIHAK